MAGRQDRRQHQVAGWGERPGHSHRTRRPSVRSGPARPHSTAHSRTPQHDPTVRTWLQGTAPWQEHTAQPHGTARPTAQPHGMAPQPAAPTPRTASPCPKATSGAPGLHPTRRALGRASPTARANWQHPDPKKRRPAPLYALILAPGTLGRVQHHRAHGVPHTHPAGGTPGAPLLPPCPSPTAALCSSQSFLPKPPPGPQAVPTAGPRRHPVCQQTGGQRAPSSERDEG